MSQDTNALPDLLSSWARQQEGDLLDDTQWRWRHAEKRAWDRDRDIWTITDGLGIGTQMGYIGSSGGYRYYAAISPADRIVYWQPVRADNNRPVSVGDLELSVPSRQ